MCFLRRHNNLEALFASSLAVSSLFRMQYRCVRVLAGAEEIGGIHYRVNLLHVRGQTMSGRRNFDPDVRFRIFHSFYRDQSLFASLVVDCLFGLAIFFVRMPVR